MTLHAQPSFDTRAPRAATAEMLSAEILSKQALDRAREEMPRAARAERLSVGLDHMGVVVAISAAASAQGAAGIQLAATAPRAEARSANLIEFQIGSLAHCRAAFAGAGVRPDAGATAHAARDPVVQRLSRALEAIEHSGHEFGGVYADAVRLAIVTRLLSVPDAAAAEPAPAPRLKSGLPKWRLKRVMAYVNEHLADTITLADMAAAAGLSRMHFAAQFRIATGLRPHEFVLRRRIELAQEMLSDGSETLVNIALSVGFQTQAHFTTVFKRFVGYTPHRWRCAKLQA